MSDSLGPYGLQPPRLLCPLDSLGKNTGVVCHALLQRVFPIQGSNLVSYVSCSGRQVLYHYHLENHAYACIHFFIFPYRPLQNTNRVHYAIEQVLIIYLFYILWFDYVNPSFPIYLPPFFPCSKFFSTSLSLLLFCKQVHLYLFKDSTYK